MRVFTLSNSITMTDGRTDQRTDQRTDKASYGVACPQLKKNMGTEDRRRGKKGFAEKGAIKQRGSRNAVTHMKLYDLTGRPKDETMDRSNC